MKDAEFIELLNLYLDHEISAADAARLEAEVQRNPARHQVYRQYCQMQKACSMLSADFTTESDAKKIIAFEPRSASGQPARWSVAGVIAVAACAALLVFNRNPAEAPAGERVVAAFPTPVAEPSVQPPAVSVTESRSIARTVTTPMPRNELQPVLTTHSLMLGGNQAVALAPAELDWIKNVQLAPMQVVPVAQELRFETGPTLKTEPAVYRSRHPIQGNIEKAAWQFQK